MLYEVITEDRGRLSRDPRGIAQKAEEYIKTQGFDSSAWGPEVEFFVFDKVHWDVLVITSYSIHYTKLYENDLY